MTQDNPREEALQLADKRTLVEQEMETITSRLCAPGGPGLTGNLLDKDGFPRGDIDIPVVRADRQRLAVLRTDYERLTRQIEAKVYAAFAVGGQSESRRESTTPMKRTADGEDARTQRGEPSDRPTPSWPVEDLSMSVPEMTDVVMTRASEAPTTTACLRPFAIIDEVTPGSPGETDGIELNDQMLRFGSVTAGPTAIQGVGSTLQASEGRPLEVEVLRRGNPVSLQVTPRKWSGRGLLGCHLRPL